jgi:hypothetical protein
MTIHYREYFVKEYKKKGESGKVSEMVQSAASCSLISASNSPASAMV